jgi:uncharacterized membrane protein
MTALDVAALAWFVLAWIGYSVLVDRSPLGERSLSRIMNRYRHRWMAVLSARDQRIVDTSIMAGLQNGTAFLASTSLLAIGAALTLLNATDQALNQFGDLPFAAATTRAQWELRCFGLTVIFVYAFFKFAWAYRLFNYASILVGAVPTPGTALDEEIDRMAERAALMTAIAGNHFNRGQRAFFFALAFLGWFVNPWVLMASTTLVVVVLVRRQFFSAPLDAVRE